MGVAKQTPESLGAALQGEEGRNPGVQGCMAVVVWVLEADLEARVVRGVHDVWPDQSQAGRRGPAQASVAGSGSLDSRHSKTWRDPSVEPTDALHEEAGWSAEDASRPLV